jgi:hypothetical protein
MAGTEMKKNVLITLVGLVTLFVVYQYDPSLFGLLRSREGFEDTPKGTKPSDKAPVDKAAAAKAADAAKMKAACSLAVFDQFGNESDRIKSISFLQEAKNHWIKYAEVYNSLYKPALYNRVGFVNIPELIIKTEADILIAKNWKQGTIKYQQKNTTEAPFRK